MKTLFIYPQMIEHGDIPIAFTTLTAVLRNAGHSVALFDCTQYTPEEDINEFLYSIGMLLPTPPPPIPAPPAKDISSLENDLLDEVSKFNPDLVGITVTSATYPLGVDCSRIIKKHHPDIKVIFGGVHPTLCPQEVIKEDSIDIICIGEGEEALLELCEAIENNKKYNKIKNLWIKDKANPEIIHKNPLRGFIDLNTLPIQDFVNFHEYEFYRPLAGKIYKMMNTDISRGCIFKCSYCVNHILQKIFKECGSYHRTKTPEIAVKHLKSLRDNYKFELIRFWDSDFTTLPLGYMKEFFKLYQREVNLPFLIHATTRTLTEEKVALLKDSNCVTIAMGLESGNKWMRKYILNRDVSDQEIIEKFGMVKKSGIRVSAYNIIGLPFETREMVFETINLNRKINPSTSSVSAFKPYPKTKLTEIAKEFGFLTKAPDFNSWRADLNSPFLSGEEVDGLVKTFSLYCKVPEEFFPLLEKAEKDEQFAQEVFPKLLRYLAS